MRVAALEVADRQIRVNSIHPGPINNRMIRSVEELSSPENVDGVKQDFEDIIPLHRCGESKEIAQLALFLRRMKVNT